MKHNSTVEAFKRTGTHMWFREPLPENSIIRKLPLGETMTMHKYNKIRRLGTEETEGLLTEGDLISIQEKIDGANFRFMLKDGKIWFGSRNVVLGDEDQEIGGRWKRVIEYITENIDREALEELNKEIGTVTIYGEASIKHSIDYAWEKMPPFQGFDVYSEDDEAYLVDSLEIIKDLNLSTVPLIKEGVFGADITKEDMVIPEKSRYGDIIEGIVIKNHSRPNKFGDTLYGKLVNENFKEMNTKNFGKTKKEAETDTEKIVATFINNRRIEKQIFKMIDDGHKLEMPMMQHLPYAVLDDFMEEEYKGLIRSRYTIDFYELRKLVSQRCVAVLKQVITNNALNGE